jgi:hypothetical protein
MGNSRDASPSTIHEQHGEHIKPHSAGPHRRAPMRFAKPVRFVVFAQFLQICADFRKRTSNAPATEAFLSFLHDAVHPFLAIRRQPTRVFEEISQG